MKKYLFTALLIMAAAVGCTNDIETPNPDGQRTITVNLKPDEATRTTFIKNGTEDVLCWNDDDAVAYFTSNNSAASKTGTSATIKSGSKFAATINTNDDHIYVVYPCGGNLGRDYTDSSGVVAPSQSQSELGVFNGANMPMGGHADISSNGNVNVEYTVFGAVLEINLKGHADRTAANGEKLEAIVLTTDDDKVLVSSTTGSVVVTIDNTPTITGTGATVASPYTIGTVYAVVNYSTEFTKTLTLKVYTNKGVYTCATDLRKKLGDIKQFDRYKKYSYSWDIDKSQREEKVVKIQIDNNATKEWDGLSSSLATELAKLDNTQAHTLKVITEGGGTVNIQNVLQIAKALRTLPETAQITVDMSAAQYSSSSFDHAFDNSNGNKDKGGTPQLAGFVFPAGHNGSIITSADYAFRGCTGLTDLSTMELPFNLKSMWGTFEVCTNLVTPPAELPTSVTNIRSIFYGCTALTSAPIIPVDVTNMRMSFYGCKELSGTLTIYAIANDLDWNTNTDTAPVGKLWLYHTFTDAGNNNPKTTAMNLILNPSQSDNIHTGNVWGNVTWGSTATTGSLARVYAYDATAKGGWLPFDLTDNSAFMTALSECDRTKIDDAYYTIEIIGSTDQITTVESINRAIDGCADNVLFNLDLSGSIYGGTSLASTFMNNDNLSGFMFPRCGNLTNLDNTFNGCSNLKLIDYAASAAITLALTDMNNTFKDCISLTDIPLLVPSSVIRMSGCFNGCTALNSPITIQENVRDVRGAFEGCTALASHIHIQSNATEVVTADTAPSSSQLSICNMFSGCTTTGITIQVPAALQGAAAGSNIWYGATASPTTNTTDCWQFADIEQP